MRKIAAVFSIVFGVVVLTASTSRTLMKQITEYRDSAPWGAWWGNHHVADAGDLVRMAYLEEIPKFRDTNLEVYTKAGAGNSSVNLYLWGDSYVKNIPDSAFYGLRSFHFGRRDYSDLVYNLDTSQTNILILSLGERFVRSVFFDVNTVYTQVKHGGAPAAFHIPLQVVSSKQYASIFPEGLSPRYLFNPAINQNIEYNLFSYNILSPVRVLKANMNAQLFKRATGDVVMSDKGDYLFLRQTVMPTGTESSYKPLYPKESEFHIAVINEIYHHYRQEGFDEVYLSIIPNTASVVQPEYYNHMLAELQDTNSAFPAKIPMIDVYSEFSKNPRQYYLRGDTHWNHHGREVWLRKVNEMLKAWDSGTYTPKQVW